MIILRRMLSGICAAFCLGGSAYADQIQDRLEQIPGEITALYDLHTDGNLDDDRLMGLLDDLLTEEMNLRTGVIAADDLTLRWRDYPSVPVKAPGARLVATGLPPDFDGLVWGTLEDGRRVDLLAEQSQASPYTADVYLPTHPDGPDGHGLLTIRFEGRGSLDVLLAPEVYIQDALPTLMRLVMDDLVRTLNRNDVNATALLEQFRTAPDGVPPELGYAAASLYIWSEAGRGDPVFGFLRTGRLEGPYWDSIGAAEDPDALNRIFSGALVNSGALEELMELQRGRIDRIRYVPHAPAPFARFDLQTVNAPTPITERVTMDEMSDLLIEGRARQYEREVYLNSAKDAQKLYSYASFEPVTMTSAALIGGVLTMVDKYKKSADYNFPVKMSLEGATLPSGLLLADDERPVTPEITILATGEPVEARVFSDGLDAALAVVDLAASLSTTTKAARDTVKYLGRTPPPRAIEGQVAAALNVAEDFILGKASSVTKDGLEAIEAEGDRRQRGSFNVFTLPARTWRAPLDPRRFRNFVSLGYSGEVAWDGTQYDARACWKDTQEGITATVTTKADAFGGLFDRLDLAWGVRTPEIDISVSPDIIPPGGTADVIAPAQGASANRVQFMPPSLGGLSGIGDLYATYGAPETIANCRELVQITAQYPPDGARICAAPPTASAALIIAKEDALVRTPQTLTCRDGEVLGFTVSHAQDAPVQCALSGPGQLTMVGNEGLLDCPVKPTQRSFITCYTGEQPGQCAPVIPIQRIYPEFAVTARVSADRQHRDRLSESGDSLFDDCGIEDLTSVALDLLDGGTGEAADLPLDPVSNPCPAAAALGAAGGGLSGGDGAAAEWPSQAPENARHVATWPLGQGRDVSVSDTHSYRHRPLDPGRGPGDRSVLVTSDISASVTIDGPESFSVSTSGATKGTSIRAPSEHPTPDGGFAEWGVWRRIVVNKDTAVTATISTRGPAISVVQAAPLRLENNVPIMLLSGFNQTLMPVMQVASVASAGLVAPQSATSELTLPGPRGDRDSLTYLIYFGGYVTPAEDGDNSVTADTYTSVTFDITPIP